MECEDITDETCLHSTITVCLQTQKKDLVEKEMKELDQAGYQTGQVGVYKKPGYRRIFRLWLQIQIIQKVILENSILV